MNSHELTLATRNIPYPSTASHPNKEERKNARDTYYTKRGELEKQWREWLDSTYAAHLPSPVRGLIFSKAWEDGHSSGYYEVESKYEEYADFVDEVNLAMK